MEDNEHGGSVLSSDVFAEIRPCAGVSLRVTQDDRTGGINWPVLYFFEAFFKLPLSDQRNVLKTMAGMNKMMEDTEHSSSGLLEELAPCNGCGTPTLKSNVLCGPCYEAERQREEWEALHPETRCPPRE